MRSASEKLSHIQLLPVAVELDVAVSVRGKLVGLGAHRSHETHLVPHRQAIQCLAETVGFLVRHLRHAVVSHPLGPAPAQVHPAPANELLEAALTAHAEVRGPLEAPGANGALAVRLLRHPAVREEPREAVPRLLLQRALVIGPVGEERLGCVRVVVSDRNVGRQINVVAAGEEADSAVDLLAGEDPAQVPIHGHVLLRVAPVERQASSPIHCQIRRNTALRVHIATRSAARDSILQGITA
mmetsp:Transcript_90485/g.235613  ORF Transcript_90485/g.235613 Transcript_90485/m.235613 type:complete len:241 (-) Transcript_90485:702-1424(-)